MLWSKTCYTFVVCSMKKLLSFEIIAVTIIIATITALGIVFFLVQPQKTISPISSTNPPAKITDISQNTPSEDLKEYVDDSGFSFNYPNDIKIGKNEISDNITYANLELTSSQAKGSITIKIADTKLKSVDDWFLENKISTLSAIKKDIKIGDILGQEVTVANKLMAIAINQEILFTIEVYRQNQKYWQTVYDTILSSFNFVPQQSKIETETVPREDSTGSEVILEEETIE